MLEMASVGAQVLEPRSVSLAKKNNVVLWVKSSFDNIRGTKISGNVASIPVPPALLASVNPLFGQVTVVISHWHDAHEIKQYKYF